jgi:hypothetical protein
MASCRIEVGKAHLIPKDAVPGENYFDRNIPVVEEQLSRAGLRLAGMLDEILQDT